MTRHGVPTAQYATCREPEEALAFLDSREALYPIVVKADGLTRARCCGCPDGAGSARPSAGS
jgi:phosphoribosylamine-glycine ligase